MERRPLRLLGFDYSSEGIYFVTACCRARRCSFGRIEAEAVLLSPNGKIARDCLVAIPEHHMGVVLDAFVVMPNHVHAVLAITQSRRATLGVIVGSYKASVSRSIGRRGLWQRGYHDHIVRDDADLECIREYIATNPLRWALDLENPDRRS